MKKREKAHPFRSIKRQITILGHIMKKNVEELDPHKGQREINSNKLKGFVLMDVKTGREEMIGWGQVQLRDIKDKKFLESSNQTRHK